jgi:hypothetical protein
MPIRREVSDKDKKNNAPLPSTPTKEVAPKKTGKDKKDKPVNTAPSKKPPPVNDKPAKKERPGKAGPVNNTGKSGKKDAPPKKKDRPAKADDQNKDKTKPANTGTNKKTPLIPDKPVQNKPAKKGKQGKAIADDKKGKDGKNNRFTNQGGGGGFFKSKLLKHVEVIRDERGLLMLDGINLLRYRSDIAASRIKFYKKRSPVFYDLIDVFMTKCVEQIEKNKARNEIPLQGLKFPVHPKFVMEAPNSKSHSPLKIYYELRHCRNPKCCKPIEGQPDTQPFSRESSDNSM